MLVDCFLPSLLSTVAAALERTMGALAEVLARKPQGKRASRLPASCLQQRLCTQPHLLAMKRQGLQASFSAGSHSDGRAPAPAAVHGHLAATASSLLVAEEPGAWLAQAGAGWLCLAAQSKHGSVRASLIKASPKGGSLLVLWLVQLQAWQVRKGCPGQASCKH